MVPEERHLSLTYDSHTHTSFSKCLQETSLFFYFLAPSFLTKRQSPELLQINGEPQNKPNPEGRVAALPHHPHSAWVIGRLPPLWQCCDQPCRPHSKAGSLYNVTLGLVRLNTRFDASSPIISTTYKFSVCDAEAFSAGRALESPRSELILQLRKLRTGGKRSCSRSPSPAAAIPRFLPSSANSVCCCARLPLMSCFPLLQQHKASIDRNQ